MSGTIVFAADAVLDRLGIHDRLDRRAGLPLGDDRAVERRASIVATADERSDVARHRVHRDGERLQVVRLVPLGERLREVLVTFLRFDAVRSIDDRGYRRALKRRIERRIEAIAAIRHRETSALGLLPHGIHEVARRRRHAAVRRGDDRLELRLFGRVGRDVLLFRHLLEDQVAAIARAVGMPDRIVLGLRFRERGECGRFGERELRRGMAEVVTRRRLDAVPPSAEVDLVDVGLEDLILGVVPLHLASRGLLVELARKPSVPLTFAPVDEIGMHVPDELLRDGAAAAAVLVENLPFDDAEDGLRRPRRRARRNAGPRRRRRPSGRTTGAT